MGDAKASNARSAGRMVRRVLIGAVVAVIVTAAVMIWHVWPRHHRFYTDADTIREPAATALVRDILWQPPVKLPEILNTRADDYEPRLSADGLTLFFVRGKAGENADIHVCRKSYEGWSEPEPLTAINSECDELGPEPSADGQSLYFYSDRPGGCGGYDLWVAHRRQDGRSEFGEPINLGPTVNSEFNDYGPALLPDGKTLYFSSNRPQEDDTDGPNPDAWPATLREDLYHRDYDLYMASITDRGFGQAQPLTTLNTSYNEGAPAVGPMGDFVYFASDRPGGVGGFDLYRSRRLRGVHQPAESLGISVNTPANELDPGLTMGGYALYFSSDRPVESVRAKSPNDYNLYYTSSREVFTEVETERAQINWAALWRDFGPHLLWALLALLLLLALLALMRDWKGRKLSLLARCLLASLFAHLLLMLLFNFWEVTAGLARTLRRGGAVHITLAAPAGGDGIAAQILGSLTDVETPAMSEIVASRQTAPIKIDTTSAMAMLTVDRGPIELEEPAVANLTVADARTPLSSEIPMRDEPIEEAEASNTLDMALPAERERHRADEPSLSVSAARRAAVDKSTLTRPPLADSVTQSSDSISDRSDAVLPPRSDYAIQISASRESLAEVPAARDAAGQSERGFKSDAVFATFDERSVSELAFPRLPEGPRGKAAERRGVVTAHTAESVRPEFVASAAPVPAAEATRNIEPASTPVETAELSIAVMLDTPASSPVPGTEDQPMRLDSHGYAVDSVRLTLPSLEEAATVAEPESSTQLVAFEAGPVRRRLASNLVSRDAREAFREIEPATIDLQEQSMAAGSAERVTDATLAQPAVGGREVRESDVSVLPLADLALSSLEERAEAAIRESPSSIEGVAPEGLRPSLSQGVTSENSLRSELFDLMPVDRRNVEDREDRLTDLLPVPRMAEGDAPEVHLPSPAMADAALFDAMHVDVRLPTEQRVSDKPYPQRAAAQRLGLVKRKGGSEATERAVVLALKWLADHQSPDGRWDGDAFDDHCRGCGGETEFEVDRALTGLALLCFLASDHTHTKDGPYQDTVRRGLQWLLESQGRDGDLRGAETMYSHGIATIALSEALGMTGDESLREPVGLAAEFIERARNKRAGGWRYDPGQAGDTSVLGWQVMALKSARMAGVEVPWEAFNAADKWLDLVSTSRGGRGSGRYAYRPGREYTPAMTAEGMFVRQVLGRRPEEPLMRASAEYITRHLPDWDSQPNTYYWYYATLALFQNQGEHWERWNEAITKQLLDNQRRDGRTAGSWDPVGEWARIGGRVYQTALCTLMLEVYYRYLPMYSLGAPADAIGTIRGHVTDMETGDGLSDATVRLDLPDRPPINVTTEYDGGYVLHPPEVPDFFALSATHEGHIPKAVNVATSMVLGTTLRLDFELQPASETVVVIEAVPEVHHLGDNEFNGRINSQFQKRAEGSVFTAEFELDRNFALGGGPEGFSIAEIVMLAKGVQASHRIFINGTLLGVRLNRSPGDGSFGEFTAALDASLLHAGINTIQIRASSVGSDVDDFEFVNLRIRLVR